MHPLGLLRARPLALLALWAPPAAAIAALTQALGAPLPAGPPDPVQAARVLGGLLVLLYAGLFLVVWFAAPTAALARGLPLRAAARALAASGAVGVAAYAALVQALALLMTQFPGLLASFVNPLMAQIFLAIGAIGGAALAVGLFGRWLHAPAFAASGASAPEALEASRAAARRARNFGTALGLSVLLAVFLLAAGAASVAAGRAGAPPAAALVASFLPLWAGLAVVAAGVAGRHARVEQGLRAPAAPTLALRARPSRCPRCGALASVPTAGPGPVACPACSLRAVLR